MSKYTPTTDEVRDGFARSDYPPEVLEARFDRWLAAEKAKWQAEAWERGYMFAFAQERGDHTHSRPVPDYLAEDIRSWNPHLTENGATR